MSTLTINKRFLDPDLSGYLELDEVSGAVYAEARLPKEEPHDGTYRGLREITVLYSVPEVIPTSGEVFDLASQIRAYARVLTEYNERPWTDVEYDWILEFPNATIFLMSSGSYAIYRQRYPEVVAMDEQIFIE